MSAQLKPYKPPSKVRAGVRRAKNRVKDEAHNLYSKPADRKNPTLHQAMRGSRKFGRGHSGTYQPPRLASAYLGAVGGSAGGIVATNPAYKKKNDANTKEIRSLRQHNGKLRREIKAKKAEEVTKQRPYLITDKGTKLVRGLHQERTQWAKDAARKDKGKKPKVEIFNRKALGAGAAVGVPFGGWAVHTGSKNLEQEVKQARKTNVKLKSQLNKSASISAFGVNHG